MHGETTQYPLKCPEILWPPLERAQGDENRNTQLIWAVATYLDTVDVELTDEERAKVEECLDKL